MKAKKTILIVAAMLLVAALSVGGTLAYLTSKTEVVKNTFTIGDVEITLAETSTVDEEKGILAGEEVKDENDEFVGFKYHILPGLKYDKEPVVTVVKGSEDCYVRAFITVSNSAEFDAIFAANQLTMADVLDFSTAWTAQRDTVVANNTRTYEVRYNEKVTGAKDAEKVLEALFTTLTVPESITNEQLATIADFTVTIKAEAIQADGFADAAAAFTALNNAQ